MARQFLTGLNLNKNELLNARIQNLATAPSGAVAGQIYYNTGDNTLRYWNGTSWLTLAQGGSVEDAINAIVDALTTDDIEEGASNLYYTDTRAKQDAAELLTGATKTNITITGDGTGLTITAENGVADSDTDDLAEGVTNLYFTEGRARASVSAGDGLDYNSTTGVISADLGYGLEIDGTGQIAVDADEIANQGYVDSALTAHANDTSTHGTTGNIVGDTDAQTLTNKTLGTGTVLSDDVDANGNTITDLGAPTVDSDAATKGYVDGEITTHLGLTSGVHGVTGDVVGTTDTQTLTNKTIGSGTTLSADLDADNHRILGVADPILGTDAANKNYVDAVSQGLHVKEGVDAASTASLATLSGGLVTYDNGIAGAGATLTLANALTTLDDRALVNGDRVLIKDEADAGHNGIYIRTSSTVFTRDPLFDSDEEIEAGDFVFVVEGTQNGSTGWVVSTTVNSVGVDDMIWIQFSGAGTYLAGNGLTLTGSIFDVVGTTGRISVTSNAVDIASDYVGQNTITTLGTVTTGTWNAGTIAVEHGGTGSTTAAGARANLGATTKYTAANPGLTQSSGSVTWTVNHNMGIRTVVVQVYTLDTFEEVEVDIERTNTNTVTLSWVSASNVPADAYQVVVVG